MTKNTRIIVERYLEGGVHDPTCLAVDESQDIPTEGQLQDGQVIVKVDSVSIDPHMRVYISESKNDSDSQFKPSLGQPIFGIGVGTVQASKFPGLSAGDLVRSNAIPWAMYSVVPGTTLDKLQSDGKHTPADFLGVLGMPAFTAYIGVVGIGKPKEGETLLVSAASGGVGQMVVQIAKSRGLRVVGIAGSDEKAAHVKSLGADDVINYKTCGDYDAAIRKACPSGIDIYFDNVGGEILDAVLLNLNQNARVALCGSMSSFGADRSTVHGVKNLDTIIVKEVTIKSLLFRFHLGSEIEREFLREVGDLVSQGKIKYALNQVDGIENAPQLLMDTFSGKNFGRQIVKVSAN